MKPVTAAALVMLGSIAMASQAAAGEIFGGIYRHDIDDQISHGHYERSPQVVIGARTASLEELRLIGSPHVHLLAGISTRGETSYLASGFSWRFNLSKSVYVQPGIGLAIHNGRINFPSPNEPGISAAERQKRIRDINTKLDLGSRVLFEPELSIGWKATERLSLEASWIHLSHAQLAGRQNPGLGDLGVRVIYRYGIDR